MKKRAVSLLLALVTCLALAVPAYAASGLKLGTAINGDPIVTGWDGPYGSHVTIPNGVKLINKEAFMNCGISGVTIPASVTSIGRSAFAGSTLTEVTIPGCSIGEEAFINCFSLTSVTISYGTTSIGKEAFCMCNHLTSVTIPDSVTEIDDGAFRGCSSLSSVTLSNSMRNIDTAVFKACTSLTSVTIPASVVTISSGAFSGCTSLTSVAIPASVTSIWYNAFEGCTSLTDIYYGGSEAQWKAIRINSSNDPRPLDLNATIHYNTDTIPEPSAFADVPAGSWYAEPVNWAVELGITNGKTPTTFAPNENCTNAQILTFLWRAAGEPIVDTQTPFPVEGYYADAARWAYSEGMVGADFKPGSSCTRADAVNYIWQVAGKGAASYDGRFTDIPANSPYATAVAWAVENGVTTGTSATRFTPDRVCDRGTIVTFLYRYFGK